MFSHVRKVFSKLRPPSEGGRSGRSRLPEQLLLVIAGGVISLGSTLAVIWTDERRHHEALALGRATLAGGILPRVFESDRLDVGDRARLLNLLEGSDAVSSTVVAKLVDRFVADRIDPNTLVVNIRPWIVSELDPFVVGFWERLNHDGRRNMLHRSRIKYCDGKENARPSEVPELGDDAYLATAWRNLLTIHLDTDSRQDADRELGSPDYLQRLIDGGYGQNIPRLYALAYAYGGKSGEDRKKDVSSDVLFFRLMGHLSAVMDQEQRWLEEREAMEPVSVQVDLDFGEDAPEDPATSEKRVVLREGREESEIVDSGKPRPDAASEYDAAVSYLSHWLGVERRSHEEARFIVAVLGVMSHDYWFLAGLGRLSGEVALPIAELFARSRRAGVRLAAAKALLTMDDCAVVAKDVLIGKLKEEVRKVEKMSAARAWADRDGIGATESRIAYKLVARLDNQTANEIVGRIEAETEFEAATKKTYFRGRGRVKKDEHIMEMLGAVPFEST